MAPMEHAMDAPTGLTAPQKTILDAIAVDPYFLQTFYLTGGTALSAWYLHHRESYDLDFFCDSPFGGERIMRWFRQFRDVLGYTSIRFDEDYGFLMCYLRFPKNQVVKIDFHDYKARRLKKGILWKGLSVDSLYDIAVNKLRTIATVPRTRDYVDLYCLLARHSYTLKALRRDAQKKFREEIDPLQLAQNFLKVEECVDMPIMIIPFEKKDMSMFYQQLALKLKTKIFL